MDTNLFFETDKIVMPDGIYTCDTVVDYMNNWFEEYNVSLEKLENGKIAIHMSMDFEYWFKEESTTQKTAFNSGTINYLQQAQIPSLGTMKISITLSDKLKFLLGGFSDLGPYFSNNNKSDKISTRGILNRTITTRTIVSSYMADASVGVNRIFFIVTRYRNLLLVIQNLVYFARYL